MWAQNDLSSLAGWAHEQTWEREKQISTFSVATGAGLGGEHDLSPEVSAVIRTFFFPSLPAFLLSI